ncbi:30015_t:CDS:2, partial [Gigaspora margarita]
MRIICGALLSTSVGWFEPKFRDEDARLLLEMPDLVETIIGDAVLMSAIIATTGDAVWMGAKIGDPVLIGSLIGDSVLIGAII